MTILCSMVGNHKQWVYYGIRSENYRNNWTSSKTRMGFHDPASSSSSGRSHVPQQPLITSSSRTKPSRESWLLRNTWEDMSIPGSVFACQPVRQNPDELYNDSGTLATSSRMNRQSSNSKKWERRTSASNTDTLLSRESKKEKSWQWRLSNVYDTWPCFSYWDLYSKWHDKSPGLSNTGNASSIDDFFTPKSIRAKTCQTLMNWIWWWRQHWKSFTISKLMSARKYEEQRAQKYDRFLRGRQIAFMMYDDFRSTGFCEETQGSSGLFCIRLENDDIQDFDLRWEQSLLSTSDPPSDKFLEDLYMSK